FDEVRYGENGEIVINDDDLPLIFYAKVYKAEDLTFNFRFNDLIKTDKSDIGLYDLKVNGGFIDYSEVIKKRNDPSYSFESIDTVAGIFDKSGIGMLFVLKSDYEKFIKDQNITNPYFYVSIDKTENNKGIYNYVYSEFSFLPSNNVDIPAPINQYTFSYMPSDKEYSLFRLRKASEVHQQILVQFGTAYTNVDFAFQDSKPTGFFNQNTSKIIMDHPSYRKDLVILEFADGQDSIYMSVFPKKKKQNDITSYQFGFKYSTAKEASAIAVPTKGYEVKYFYDSREIHFQVPQIKFAEKFYAEAKYNLKFVLASEVPKEVDISSIGPSNVNYVFSRSADSTSEEEYMHRDLPLTDLELKKEKYKAVVTAYVKELNEIISYGVVEFEGKGEKKPTESKIKWGVIVIIIIIILVLVAAGVVLYFFLKNRKPGSNDVLKTSFIGSNLVPGDDDEKNILN
ncbi:MAG: hypothetical protein MJ252_30270, partial [archaeon]|nr:hypothetical protein [archaeon]